MICLPTVKRFCSNFTEIENYDKAIADTEKVWECHHKLELIETGAVVDSTKQDLIDWGIYYDRPADELIFLTKAEHRRLHANWKKNKFFAEKGRTPWNKGIPMSNETRKKISENRKGKGISPRGPMSAEHKEKERITHLGKKHSNETKRKMSESAKKGWEKRRGKLKLSPELVGK